MLPFELRVSYDWPKAIREDRQPFTKSTTAFLVLVLANRLRANKMLAFSG